MATVKVVDGDYTIISATQTDIVEVKTSLFKTTAPFQVGEFTTATRNLLSTQNGQIIYNIDTNKFQGCAAGVWVDLN